MSFSLKDINVAHHQKWLLVRINRELLITIRDQLIAKEEFQW